MPGVSRGIEIVPCPADDLEAALAVLYRRVSFYLRPRLIAEAVAEVARGEMDLSGLWVARRGGRIVGTLLTQGLAGRAAALWPPEVALRIGRSAVAADLVRTALDDLRRRGFRLAQALVDLASHSRATKDLTLGGLPRVTELVYMARDTATPLESGEDRDARSFDWAPYSDANAADFAEVIQRTYIDSLDMPELDGVRSLDDVLASHQAGGRFDPGRWHLGRLDGEPGAGAILLLSEQVDRAAWELAYLGLTPPARGRGLGRSALRFALELAGRHCGRLELAVDIRNHPAHRLYQAAGFLPFDRRVVHLATLGD